MKRNIETRFLLPTSNVCVRFFSTFGDKFDESCKHVLPIRDKEQLFLNGNSTLWKLADIQHIFARNEWTHVMHASKLFSPFSYHLFIRSLDTGLEHLYICSRQTVQTTSLRAMECLQYG